MAELGVAAEIIMVNVADDDEARSRKFLGSPSIRINGRDLELEENESTQHSMRCRAYCGKQGFFGMPSKQAIEAALLRAMKEP